MKKNAFFSLIFLLVCLTAAGCGKEDPLPGSDGKDADVSNNIMETSRWSASHFPMPEQYEGATIDDDKIYAYRYGKDGVEISVFAINAADAPDTVNAADAANAADAVNVAGAVNAQGSVAQTLSYEIPGVVEVKSISINASKQICLWGSTESGDNLWQINPDGGISTIENIEVEDLGNFPELINFYADSNGFYYIWYKMSVPCSEVYEDGEEDYYTRLDRIYVKDQQMNTIVYEQVPDSYNNQLLGFAFDEAGIPMLFAKDGEGYYYVQRVRTTDREEYERSPLENVELMNLEGSGTIAFTEDGLLYTREGALYLYHLSEAREEKLLELSSAGIMEKDIIYLGKKGGAIEIIDNYAGLGQSEYTAITEGESVKTRLTLGVMSLRPKMRELIAAFNRFQDEVALEPIVYMEDGDWDYDAGYQRLTMDIIQRKAPDLIDTSGLDYDNLARMGAFSDLYTFLKEDPELGESDLVSSVLHAYEMDGHLYTISPSFLIISMWGAGSTVKGRQGVSLEEMMQLLRERGGDINSIRGLSADEDVLTTLCALSMDHFIDWEEGTCNFTGKEFRQVLDFAKEYQGKTIGSLYKAVRNGDILLELGIISSVEDYRLQSELYGENIQFIGYPTESGSGSAVEFTGAGLAVNSMGEHQKEAWEFVRFFIQNGYDGVGFPVMQEGFDTFLMDSLEEEYVEEDGETSAVVKKSYIEKDIVSIYVTKCGPEDVEAVKSLVEHISGKSQYHTEVQKIIDEEAPAYFQGQKGIEEVCDIIQRRVALYLGENQY